MKKEQTSLKFLALGDSYTIGERVKEDERWPNQLISKVSNNNNQITFEPVEIIAVTGWTTGDLTKGIAVKNPAKAEYDFVSLLIGVNNQYRGYPISEYEKEFEELLKKAISYKNANGKVFVVSIPDYGVTPFAQSKNPEKISKEIDDYNQIAERISKKYDVTFFDINPISKKAQKDLSYVAEDLLHPSGVMYEEWADLILPWLEKQVVK